MQMTPNQVIFLREKRAKIPWRSESTKRPMSIEGIKMSLIHSCPPPFILLIPPHSSIWDCGQVPPRTLRLINHPHFNICPVPKGCPPPLLHPLWRWDLGFIPFSASLHILPQTPPPDWQNIYCPMPKWRRDPLFPSLTKAVWSQDGDCQPRCLGPGRGAPFSPRPLLSRLLVHPFLALALFFTFNTPLLWRSLTQLALHPFHGAELSAAHKDIKWQQREKTGRFGRKRYSTWLSVAILHAFCSLGCSWNR